MCGPAARRSSTAVAALPPVAHRSSTTSTSHAEQSRAGRDLRGGEGGDGGVEGARAGGGAGRAPVHDEALLLCARVLLAVGPARDDCGLGQRASLEDGEDRDGLAEGLQGAGAELARGGQIPSLQLPRTSSSAIEIYGAKR